MPFAAVYLVFEFICAKVTRRIFGLQCNALVRPASAGVTIGIIVLATLGFREDVSQLCELKFSVNETTDYIILTAYNTVTNKELVITPNLINANDTTDWGCSISPVFFNRIAKVFSFKYTQQTHDAVCNCFAKHTYGDANHKIPEIYLPVNEKLLECLI